MIYAAFSWADVGPDLYGRLGFAKTVRVWLGLPTNVKAWWKHKDDRAILMGLSPDSPDFCCYGFSFS